jgi:hypothetical protein
MKKQMILMVLPGLVVVHFSILVVALWSNPNSYWLEDIDCGEVGSYKI